MASDSGITTKTAELRKRVIVRYDDERQLVWLDPECPEIEAMLGLRTIAAAHDPVHGYRLDRRLESLLSPSRMHC